MGPQRPAGLPASAPEVARRSEGKECKKQMYSASRLRLLRTRLFLAVHDLVSRRHEKDRHDDRNKQATNDCPGQRGVLFAAWLGAESHGDQAQKGCQGGHQDGTKTQASGGRDGFLQRLAVMMKMTGKLDDQDAVRNHDANHHHQSHQGHHVQRGARREQEQEHAGKSGRYRQKDDEGILPCRELRNQNQIHQDDGEEQADSEALEGSAHALRVAPQVYTNSFRQLGVLDNFFHLASQPAEIFALRRHVYIDHTKQLIVVYFRRGRNSADFYHAIEGGRFRAFPAAQGNLLQIGHRLDLVLGILDGQQVGVTARWIDPVIRRDHAVRSEGGDDVVDDFFLRETEETGLPAVNVELQGRVIDILGNQNVADAPESANKRSDLCRCGVNAAEIVAANLYVNGRGQAEIDDRIDEPARLKVGAELRELLAKLPAHAPHVLVAADRVALLKTYLHERGVRRRIGRVNRRKIRGDADVRNDDLELVGWHHLVDDLLHLFHIIFGEFHAGSGGRLQVDYELTGIGSRKEGDPEKRIERKR